MPLNLSLDWGQPQPQIKRVVIVFHGKSRDVDGYYRAILKAREQAPPELLNSSVIIAPQFLNGEDIDAHKLPNDWLHWTQGSWEGGAESSGKNHISAYSVIDLIVQHITDQKAFPNLTDIVFVGHSGGAQAVQRYAIVGQALSRLPRSVHCRFVIANPSSYLYFTGERPDLGDLRFEGLAHCSDANRWRYGIQDIRGEYVNDSSKAGWKNLEDRYASEDVLYLLGTADIDFHEKDLDVSCAAELQGPNRFVRGQAYFVLLHHRHNNNWGQRLWYVPDVAHSASKMFESHCGVAAIFDSDVCQNQLDSLHKGQDQNMPRSPNANQN